MVTYKGILTKKEVRRFMSVFYTTSSCKETDVSIKPRRTLSSKHALPSYVFEVILKPQAPISQAVLELCFSRGELKPKGWAKLFKKVKR